ncbi:hypothetical protein M404DRAFT_25677 [Pisolithus tinctorius Marx 270]|uniref:Uncharacterized protein n=1 Tax=Pisolithus tinctorius Marx 270 TaxID=870435 RepID=A0A0C3NVZ4_PISTI|nr:hypothetical protein M404DRAFT_25677 [Pisolithus tinctorius Marx 270]
MASILAFFYSANENSGQCIVTFKCLNDNIEIVVQRDVFPVNHTLSETDVHVNGIHFRILFDCHRHQRLHSQASYLFIRINQHGLPTHIWPENDLHHILEALLVYSPILPSSVILV